MRLVSGVLSPVFALDTALFGAVEACYANHSLFSQGIVRILFLVVNVLDTLQHAVGFALIRLTSFDEDGVCFTCDGGGTLVDTLNNIQW